MDRREHEPPFDVLVERATPRLLDRLGAEGITRIEYVVGFSYPWKYSVWLCADTDAQRDSVAAKLQPLLEEVRAVLLEVGIEAEHLHDLGITTESQETVDRDFGGSWFSALR